MGLRASGFGLRVAAALAVVAGAGCTDGGGVTSVRALRTGLTPAEPSVTAPVTALTHPQTLAAHRSPSSSQSLALNDATAILPIPFFSSFDVTQKLLEFVEGAVFVGRIEPANPTRGAVQLLHSGVGVGSSTSPSRNRDYWPPDGTALGPVRGLALDVLEFDPRETALDDDLFSPLDPSQVPMKGRLWIATGSTQTASRLHVIAGRADSSQRPAVQLAEITATAAMIPDPSTEFFTSIASGPESLTLFVSTQRQIFRVTPAPAAADSAIEALAELPTSDGREILALASDREGRLYIARGGAAGVAFSIVETAPLVAAPAAVADFPLSVAVSATAISVNSAGRLVVAERATGRFYEFDRSGALVAQIDAPVTASFLPSPPNLTSEPVTASAGPDQITVFACDPYISRIVFATQPAGGNVTVRTIANVTFRGGVVPIFENRCTFCHASAAPAGGLDLSGPPDLVRSRLLIRSCETFAPTDTALPAECGALPVQNPFFRTDIPLSTDITGVFTEPGGTCPNCPYPLTLPRVEPFAPTASYIILKVLASEQSPLNVFPVDFDEPSFTNNCASTTNTALVAVPFDGQVCGERMPLASFAQRPIRRAEIDMIEQWVRDGAPDD